MAGFRQTGPATESGRAPAVCSQVLTATLHAAATGGLCVAQGVSTTRLARLGSIAAVEPALAPLLGIETGPRLLHAVALRRPLAGPHAVERLVGPSARPTGRAGGGGGGGFHGPGSHAGRCVLSGSLWPTRP